MALTANYSCILTVRGENSGVERHPGLILRKESSYIRTLGPSTVKGANVHVMIKDGKRIMTKSQSVHEASQPKLLEEHLTCDQFSQGRTT